MKKAKRILALLGAIILVLMYISTLVFALIGSPTAYSLFKASIACTVFLPVMLYAYILVYRVLTRDDDDDFDSSSPN